MERRMKNKVVIAFVIFLALIFLCNKNSQVEIYKVSPELYEFDKKTIAEAFLNNVEYYRLHYPYNLERRYMHSLDSIEASLIDEKIEKHFQKYPKVKRDPANFYLSLANRTMITGEYVNSPIPTKEEVFVSTDSIFYNKNASLCIAFLCVEHKCNDIDGLENIPHTFLAEALVGYRKHPNDTLKTYPLTIFRLMGYDKKKTLVEDLIKLYTSKLKWVILPGTIYGWKRFRYNVGEKGFFTDSPLFLKYNDTTYYFQMYKALGEDCHYDYPY